MEAHFRGEGRRVRWLEVSHAFHSPLMEPMLEDFRQVVGKLTFNPATIPAVSTVTGEPDPAWDDPEYWVEHVRRPVRYADAVTALDTLGVTRFVEIGPQGVLTALTQQNLPDDTRAVMAVPSLRAGQDEPQAVLTALARLHVTGVPVDWQAFYGEDHRPSRIDLPTYAFQRDRYWLTGTTLAAAAPTALGQQSADHPLLGAAVDLPDSDSQIFTGRLSTSTHPWLADHDVLGTILLPGAAFVELALHVGGQVDCPLLEELSLQAPLILPDRGARQLRLVVDPPGEDGDGDGTRSIGVYSRAESPGAPWVRHAAGTVGPGRLAAVPVPVTGMEVWPPAGAIAVEPDELYDTLYRSGLALGDAWRGARALWRRGDEVYAEIVLPDCVVDGEGYAVHPALLDLAAHLYRLVDGEGPTRLPSAWTGVAGHTDARAPETVRVRVASDDDRGVSVVLTDPEGRLLLTADVVEFREMTPDELRVTDAEDDMLHRPVWKAVPLGADATDHPVLGAEAVHELVASQERVPELVVFESPEARDPLPGGLLPIVDQVRAVLRSWVAEERPAASTLVVVTRHAVAVDRAEGASLDLVQAAVRGLVRAAQAEHPGRFVLLDLDADEASASAGVIGAAVATGESELALRGGSAFAPRLERVTGDDGYDSDDRRDAVRLPAEGTVLVTGGTRGVGVRVAHHLVAAHGARHLLLTGDPADETLEQVAALRALGAEVTVAECEASDRARLAELLAALPDDRPLVGVVHAADAQHNALIDTMSPEQLAAVLRAGAEAAWNLHELTEGHDLAVFLLISSSTSLFLGTGQANTAASAALLDALALRRRTLGLPALSLALGPRERGTEAGTAYTERMRRTGIRPLTADEAPAVVTRGLETGEFVLVPVRLDQAVLRAADELPDVLAGLVRAPARRPGQPGADGGGELRRRLSGLPGDERVRVLLALVREQVAAVLGHTSAEGVEPDRAFQELGFDSLAAVELRRRLTARTGVALASTLAFDHPTSRAVAGLLDEAIEPAEEGAEQAVLAEIERLETVLAAAAAAAAVGGGGTVQITARLEALLQRWRDTRTDTAEDTAEVDFEAAGDDELFDVLDRELGIS
ncbi:KR domain-containing protein [Streptomyces sp. NPDC019531]|uniref:KR domain-containing protein n=1 Tax=Streptomyces sp. NPDC019531 TaxID=3365062 RepID=UPI00384D4E54